MNWFMRLFKRNDKPILLAWGPNNFRPRELQRLFNLEAKLVIFAKTQDGRSTWTFQRAFLRSVDTSDPYFSFEFDVYQTELDTTIHDRKPEPFK